MNDDELKKLWREQPLGLPPDLTESWQLSALRKKMKWFDRTIWWRDFRESAAGLVVIAIFGIYFFTFPSALARLGCVLTILSAVFTDFWALWNKRKAGREIPGASVMDSLRVQLRKVETQIRLLRSVFWWYILPLMGGAGVFYCGINRDTTERTATLITFLLVGWFIHWLNQLAVRRKLVPLKNELESLLGIPAELRTKVKSRRIKWIFLLVLLVVGGPFLARWLYTQASSKSDADITALLEKCVAQQKRAPGMVIGVIDDKGVRVFAKGTFENGRGPEVNGDTLFEIGGVTTVFTGLVLQEMADRGEVKLEDPIGKYLPSTVKTPTRNGREITLVDLATQLSGLPRLPDNLDSTSDDNPYAGYTVGQLYDFLSHYQLKRDIGAKFLYSNLGTGLLGHLLALRAGTNYEALVVRGVCDPLQMNSTRITLSPDLKGRLAPGHDAAGQTVANWDNPTLAGCGALRSTANDLLKFLAANLDLTNSSLSNALLAAQQPRYDNGFLRGKVGLCWQINTGGTISQDGLTGGYSCYVGFDKGAHRAVVVLANSENSVEDIGEYLMSDRPDVKHYEPPKVHKLAKVDPRIYDRYVGQYKFWLSSVTMTVTREGPRLYARLTGQQKFEFFPESETDFFCKEVDAQLTFEKDSTGAVKDVILHQNGMDQKVTKVKK